MAGTNLGKLVEKAKGDDRSLRKYAIDSGVDAAVISKIINGSYVPKKPDVYMSLTSEAAHPRGGVTCKDLIEAANPDSSYIAGMNTAFSVLASTTGLLGNISGLSTVLNGLKEVIPSQKDPRMKKNKKITEIEEAVKEMQRFVATANGLILTSLATRGIAVKIDGRRCEELANNFDTYLSIDDHGIEEYIIRYSFIPQNLSKDPNNKRRYAKKMIEELVFLPPSERRKVSIVIDSEEVYKDLCKYKEVISYNGELSLILFDVEKVKLVNEEYISHFGGQGIEKEIRLF